MLQWLQQARKYHDKSVELKAGTNTKLQLRKKKRVETAKKKKVILYKLSKARYLLTSCTNTYIAVMEVAISMSSHFVIQFC